MQVYMVSKRKKISKEKSNVCRMKFLLKIFLQKTLLK